MPEISVPVEACQTVMGVSTSLKAGNEVMRSIVSVLGLRPTKATRWSEDRSPSPARADFLGRVYLNMAEWMYKVSCVAKVSGTNIYDQALLSRNM